MGLMMKRFQLKFASLIVVCCLVASQRGFSEESSEESHEGPPSTRETKGKEPVATEFDKIIETLKGKIREGGTLVLSGTSSDETSRGASPNLNKSAAQSVTINIAAITDLKKALETVSSYAKKMKGCGDGGTDQVSVEVLKVLNQFIKYLVKTTATETSINSSLDRKEINTFVVIVQNALAEKKTKFTSAKATFEKSDDEVSGALVNIAKILQGGVWDRNNIDSNKVDGDLAIKAVKTVAAGITMCVLDPVTPNPNPNQTAPPTIDPSGGASVVTPPQVISNPATPPGSFNQNQFQEALDRLRRAEAERDAERNRADELAQRNPNERDNEQAIKALQGALNQAQRPNNSRGNSDRSEQGPQISPSISTPPSQQGQIPQIPPFQPPPPQPFPLGALGQPSGQTPFVPYQPSRFNDDIPQRPAVAQPDPSTAMLLQQLAQQNQMFQQQMMSRNPYLNNNGVSNVNGNALQNFNSGGPRFARGGSSSGPRILPGRFTGATTSGIQGRMGINPSARGPLPSRLNR